MRDSSTDYDRLQRRIGEWAEGRADLEGVVVIGSRAREERPADEYSDLDLLVFSTDPGTYIDDDSWVADLGDPIPSFVEGTATGDRRERRVLFAAGRGVDFVPLAATMDLFAWVARETAETMGFDYPEGEESRTRALVGDVLAQEDGSL